MPRKSGATQKRGRGRPPTGATPMRRVLVTLDPASIERALQLGEGNLSAGIRRAIEKAAP